MVLARTPALQGGRGNTVDGVRKPCLRRTAAWLPYSSGRMTMRPTRRIVKRRRKRYILPGGSDRTRWARVRRVVWLGLLDVVGLAGLGAVGVGLWMFRPWICLVVVGVLVTALAMAGTAAYRKRQS